MTEQQAMEEGEDDLDVFIAAIDAELTRIFGPNHQEILGNAGSVICAFEW